LERSWQGTRSTPKNGEFDNRRSDAKNVTFKVTTVTPANVRKGVLLPYNVERFMAGLDMQVLVPNMNNWIWKVRQWPDHFVLSAVGRARDATNLPRAKSNGCKKGG
jgi:hypothetical protein